MRTRMYSNGIRDFTALANAVNRNVGRFGAPYDYASNGGNDGKSKLTMPVDIWTSEGAYHIAAYLPGVDPDAVEITFEGDKLTIRGELPNPHEETNTEASLDASNEAVEETVEEAVQTQEINSDVKYIRRELFHGSFERTLTFNVSVNSDDISATFKHGVLTLDVPKSEEILPKQIKVHVA